MHQPQYIPWLGYFDKISKSDAFVFLDKVQYKARELQNRNKIRTKDGWIWLTVPVLSKGMGRQAISDVMVDNTSDWAAEHLRSLETSYGRSRYFGKHSEFFRALYARRWEKLYELNVEIIKYLLKEFSIDTPVYFESGLDIKSAKTDRIVDICSALKADTYLSGSGGRAYLEEDKFKSSGIKLSYQDYKHPVYRQQFAKTDEDFIPYMSALDLVFNEGPASGDILGRGR